MPVVKNLMVRIGADFSAISAQATKAQKSMNTMRADVTKSCSAMQSSLKRLQNTTARTGTGFSGLSSRAVKTTKAMSGASTGIAKSCSLMSSAFGGLSRILSMLGIGLSVAALVSFSRAAKEAYEVQSQAEKKLAVVMQQRMSAQDDTIRSIYNLASAQQALGIIGDEVQLSGAQQISTFLKQADSLRTLIPSMNDLLAQQKGLNATSEDAVKIGNMLGKAMQGQATALKRVGITFSDAQANVLKYGTEEQRAVMLADIITQNVGHMNSALASTPSGRLKQLSNTLGDIKEQFGGAVTSILTAFLPALQAVARVLSALASFATRVAQSIANVFGKASPVAATAGYTAAAAGSMYDFADATNAAAAAGSAAKKSLGTFSFDTLQKLSSSGSSGSGGSGAENEEIAINGGGLIGGMEESTKGITALENAFIKLKETVQSFDFSNLTDSSKLFLESFSGLSTVLSPYLKTAFDEVLVPFASWQIDTGIPKVIDNISAAVDLLSAVLKKVKPVFDWYLKNILKPIFKILGYAYEKISDFSASAIGKLADKIRGTGKNKSTADLPDKLLGNYEKHTDKAVKATDDLFSSFKKGIEKSTDKTNDLFQSYKKGSDNASSKISTHFSNFIKQTGSATEKTNTLFGRFKKGSEESSAKSSVLFRDFNKNADDATDKCSGIFSGFKTYTDDASEASQSFFGSFNSGADFSMKKVQTLSDRLRSGMSTLSGLINSALGGINGKLVTVANGMLSTVEGIINFTIRGINRLSQALNKLKFNAPSWLPLIGGKSWSPSFTQISEIKLPRLADGAVLKANNPYLAVVGDQKRGTNVETPVDTMVNAMFTALRKSGGGTAQQVEVVNHVTFEGTMGALARALAPAIVAEIKRIGPSASQPQKGIA